MSLISKLKMVRVFWVITLNNFFNINYFERCYNLDIFVCYSLPFAT